MSQYFSPHRSHGGDIKVELHLNNYQTHVAVSNFASKTNLADLKTEVDKIDVNKLKTVPVDLAKLSNVVKNDSVKKTEYNSLKTKINSIDTTNFVLKTKYGKDGSDFEDKISKIDKKYLRLVVWLKKTDFSCKFNEIESKIPSISGLATNTALTAVKNKILDVSSLVKKTDYNAKISEIENKVKDHNHDKYITTPEFNTMATDVFNERLAAQTYLIRKPEFDFKLDEISDRVTKSKPKHLLVENELKKLKNLDAAYFRGRSHFEEDGTGSYLVFQPIYRYYRRIVGVGRGNYIYFWKSIGLSDERLNSNTASNYKINPELSYYGTKIRVEFNGNCLKQVKVTCNHRKIVNIYIAYEISKNYSISTYPTLENCLFGAVSLTKNADIDKYKYSGYGIGFDREGEFSFGNGFGRNCIIFEADLSSSLHANNKKNNVLVLGKDFVQGINGTTIYAEKLYSFNFTENNKKFCSTYIIMEQTVIYLLMVQKSIYLKQKILRLQQVHYV